MCHMSYEMCHVLCVTCLMSPFFLIFFFLKDKVVKLVGGGSDINRANPSRLKDIDYSSDPYTLFKLLTIHLTPLWCIGY